MMLLEKNKILEERAEELVDEFRTILCLLK